MEKVKSNNNKVEERKIERERITRKRKEYSTVFFSHSFSLFRFCFSVFIHSPHVSHFKQLFYFIISSLSPSLFLFLICTHTLNMHLLSKLPERWWSVQLPGRLHQYLPNYHNSILSAEKVSANCDEYKLKYDYPLTQKRFVIRIVDTCLHGRRVRLVQAVDLLGIVVLKSNVARYVRLFTNIEKMSMSVLNAYNCVRGQGRIVLTHYGVTRLLTSNKIKSNDHLVNWIQTILIPFLRATS